MIPIVKKFFLDNFFSSKKQEGSSIAIESPLNGISTPYPARDKILKYCADVPLADRAVVFGGHWSNNPGWLVLSESEQNLAERLMFDNDSVAFIFTEHVVEHLSFVDAVNFFSEAHRVLTEGGILRVVCPVLDVILKADFNTDEHENYVSNSIFPNFDQEMRLLSGIGLGSKFDLKPFFLNSMMSMHGHKFIWSYALLTEVLVALGFNDVQVFQIGEGRYPEKCIERRRRGLYLGSDYQIEFDSKIHYDIESGIVEAVKFPRG